MAFYHFPREGAKYCDECLSVCLSVWSHISKTTRPIHQIFVCMSPMAATRPSSDGVATCHVLPVLWMTSYFNTMGQMARIKHDVICSKEVRQVAVRIGCQTTTAFGQVHCGGKSYASGQTNRRTYSSQYFASSELESDVCNRVYDWRHLVKATEVTAGLAECNGSLPPGG